MNTTFFTFLAEINTVREQYAASKQPQQLKAALLACAETYADLCGAGDYLLNIGEEYITSGDAAAGRAVITAVSEAYHLVENKTGLYLRLAAFHIEEEDIEKGTAYLRKLCTDTVSNYEESIAFNGLTDLWETYKPLVAGKVPPSVPFHTAPAPLPPEKCAMSIRQIMALPREDLLSALSDHLGELSANGECVNCLNKWERTAFYADELCMEVNSGGFEGYLYYNGRHFEKAYQALEAIGAAETAALLDRIRAKFPRKKVPKSTNAIQNALDAMEAKGIDFESEDTVFYETAEKELLKQLLAFVLQNEKHFR